MTGATSIARFSPREKRFKDLKDGIWNILMLVERRRVMVGKFKQFQGVMPVLCYGLIESRQKAAVTTLGKYGFGSMGIFRILM